MENQELTQRLTKSLLMKFIEICKNNHLRYYVTGGALIGVLRHKGFIPWDDDVDIGMPRKDYDRFLEILEKNMPEGYGNCNRFTDPNWNFGMSQFLDLESEIEIDLTERTRKAHIWIDVFPLDGLPSNAIYRWFRIKHIMLYRYLVQIAHIETQVDIHRERAMIERVVLDIFRAIPIGKLINTSRALNRMEQLLRKNDFDDAQYVGNMLGRYREREAVPKSYFGTPQQGLFEGIEVDIPEMSHELLTALYGNYMKLPAESNRIAHNVRIIRCRKGFEE